MASRPDVINADRSSLSPEWEKYLCEYYLSPRTTFLRRQMKKFLMFICGSREKYWQLRDFHLLSTNLQEIRRLTSSTNEKTKTKNSRHHRPSIPYSTLIRLVELLRSSEEISVPRASNWQHFCLRADSSILPFLFRLLLHVPHPSLIPSLLHLLISAISSPPASSSSKALKSSQSVMVTTTTTTRDVKDNDLVISSLLVVHLSKMIEKDEFEQFIRLYLLENGDQSVRWLTHSFLWHFYSSSSRSIQSDLFDVLLDLFSKELRHHGSKSFQFLDLLGSLVVKNEDDPRSSKFVEQLSSTFVEQSNVLLVEHPNASIYRSLTSFIDVTESSHSFYLESDAYLHYHQQAENNIPYRQLK